MKHKELQAFIHETARLLPEERRSGFLELLAECAGIENDNVGHTAPGDDGQEEIVEEMETIIAELEEISNGEKCLDRCIHIIEF